MRNESVNNFGGKGSARVVLRDSTKAIKLTSSSALSLSLTGNFTFGAIKSYLRGYEDIQKGRTEDIVNPSRVAPHIYIKEKLCVEHNQTERQEKLEKIKLYSHQEPQPRASLIVVKERDSRLLDNNRFFFFFPPFFPIRILQNARAPFILYIYRGDPSPFCFFS